VKGDSGQSDLHDEAELEAAQQWAARPGNWSSAWA